MNEARIAAFLIDDLSGAARDGHRARLDPKVNVLMGRAMLQIYSVPSLENYLYDAGVVNNEDGTATLEFDFLRLPEEILSQVERLLSAHEFEDHTFSRYVKNGQAHTGLTLKVDPKKIPGDAYDYAY